MKRIFRIVLFLLLFIPPACERDILPGTDMASKIAGDWRCEEKSRLFGNSTYQVTISEVTGQKDKIMISNFYHLGSGKEIEASLNGYDIYITLQELDGNSITGTGVITSDANRIDLSFTVNDKSGDIDNVTAILTPY